MSAIPGVELVEMERNKRWSYCCGSGAKISSACYSEFSASTTKEPLAEEKRAAGTIVTACTTCVSRMNRIARKEGMQVEISDLSILAAEGLGIELSPRLE